MQRIIESIKQNKLINPGDVIGIAVSGGKDSMALLHYLSGLQDTLDFELVAVTIDHSIREESSSDAMFVMDYCKEHNIRAYKFKVDAKKVASDNKLTLEEGARIARYNIFKGLERKGVVDRMVLAHHLTDQTESILMHIFRGSQIKGAKGMDYIRDNYYIRPMLDVDRQTIDKYILDNDIPYVEDKTNNDDTYARNYLRNVVLPLIRKQWPNLDQAVSNFGKACKEDDEYINSMVMFDCIAVDGQVAQIPLSCFMYNNSIVSRLIFKAIEKISTTVDIERKHIELIINLSKLKNGSKIDLPNRLTAIKEYEYISIISKDEVIRQEAWDFKVGKIDVNNFGRISVRRIQKEEFLDEIGKFGGHGFKNLYFDFKKVPKDAIWRYKQENDTFTKFGGGSKKLKSYLIDKKVPKRIRDDMPVLVSGNEVYIIPGIEISDKIKIDEDTKQICRCEIKK